MMIDDEDEDEDNLVPIHNNDYMMIIHGLHPRKISKMDEDENNCGPLPALLGNN